MKQHTSLVIQLKKIFFMKKIMIILSSLIFCLSCASQKKEIIAKSTIKLEGKNTNIRDLLEIDGVFNFSTVFYEDGTWVNFSMEKNDDDRINNLFNYVNTWIKGRQIRWGTNWGVYKIQNDTIITYSYNQGSLLVEWLLDEGRFKIIDRKTIKLIYAGELLDVYKRSKEERNVSPWIERDPIHFTPVDTLPPADCWLKEEKWIWRQESDWKAYMQHVVEQVKKQYKKK
jgi:hypothetical protein